MLTLSRKIGESIIIQNGDEVIEVKLSKIKGPKAEISIAAPREYVISREELLNSLESD